MNAEGREGVGGSKERVAGERMRDEEEEDASREDMIPAWVLPEALAAEGISEEERRAALAGGRGGGRGGSEDGRAGEVGALEKACCC